MLQSVAARILFTELIRGTGRERATAIFVNFWKQKNAHKIQSLIGSHGIMDQYLKLYETFWFSQKTFLCLMSDFTITSVCLAQFLIEMDEFAEVWLN